MWQDRANYAVSVTDGAGKKRKVGWLNITMDTLISPRSINRHLFRSGRATVEQARADGVASWGLDAGLCDELLRQDVKYLEIRTDEGTYRTTLQQLCDKGYVLHMKPHKPQRFLQEQYFEIIDRGLQH